MVGQKVGDPGGRELDRGVNRCGDLPAIYNFLFFRMCNYSGCNSYVGCIIWINTGGFCWY